MHSRWQSEGEGSRSPRGWASPQLRRRFVNQPIRMPTGRRRQRPGKVHGNKPVTIAAVGPICAGVASARGSPAAGSSRRSGWAATTGRSSGPGPGWAASGGCGSATSAPPSGSTPWPCWPARSSASTHASSHHGEPFWNVRLGERRRDFRVQPSSAAESLRPSPKDHGPSALSNHDSAAAALTTTGSLRKLYALSSLWGVRLWLSVMTSVAISPRLIRRNGRCFATRSSS
jgi:hypothetical protein